MRLFLCLACVLSACIPMYGEHPFEYSFSANKNGQHINVTLQITSFDSGHHVLEKRGRLALIDGRVPIGTGPGSFSVMTAFSRFEVRWNGERVDIPTSLYADLFNASLTRKTNPVFDSNSSVWTTVNEDGNSVLIEFEGGDDGAAYKASIIVRRDGKHLRFVENTTP